MDDLAVLRRQDNFSGRIFDSEQTVLLKHLNPLGRNGTSVFNLKGISGIRYFPFVVTLVSARTQHCRKKSGNAPEQ